MAFLQIKTENPQISFLIKKNPASGLFVRELRKGTIFGYFSDENLTYNIYFRDAMNEISYPEEKDQEFEYINTTRYSSAQFVLNALSDVVRDAMKKHDSQLDPDDTFKTSITLNLIKLENKRTLSAFLQHFEECEIRATLVANKHYRIVFETKRSLYYLLNLVNLFAAFTAIRNKTEYLPRDEGMIEKYLGSLSVIDAPYFIRYHLKIELLRGNAMFTKYKGLLEKTARYPILLKQGDTNYMRRDEVERCLDFSNHIVDIGCGEGWYVWSFAKRLLKDKKYYAIDIDANCRQIVERKAKLQNLNNVEVLESFADLLDNFFAKDGDDIDFILGEVIEHMELAEATTLVQQCLLRDKCNSVIVTTPNADFNRFYFEDGGMRHPDHKFELTHDGFLAWVDMVLETLPTTEQHLIQKGVLHIGDKVDGIPTTLGVIFKKLL